MRLRSKMSPPARNDNCSIHSAGNSTTTSNSAAAPCTATRSLFIALRRAAETADEPAQQQYAGNHQRCDRTAVAPIGEIKRLDKGVIVGHLGRGAGPAIGQYIDQRERLDAVDHPEQAGDYEGRTEIGK